MILALIFGLAFAQTTFIFHEDQCFEVDTETYGQKFASKVLINKCRPEKVKKFWQQNPSDLDGDCYEVDEETGGTKYRRKILDKDCLPEKYSKEWIVLSDGKGICVLKDYEGAMAIRGNNKECAGEKAETMWQPNQQNPLMGSCIQMDSTTGAVIKTDISKCKPKSISYLWIPKERNPGEGTCYEVDSEKGVMGYSNRADDKLCKSKDLGLQYDQIKNECYLMAVSHEGHQMKLKASSSDCKPAETKKIFIKETPIYGVCFEISAHDEGKSYKARVNTSECRPPEGKWELQIVNVGGIERCLVLPVRNYPSDYVESVDIKKCTNSTGNLRFALKEDGREGECFEKMDRGGQIIERKVLVERCLPKETYIIWHNFSEFDGGCFEVDKLKGPSGYFKSVELKLCKPIFTKFVFIKNYGKIGQCFEVDSETGGKKYHRKVGPNPCKENLLKSN